MVHAELVLIWTRTLSPFSPWWMEGKTSPELLLLYEKTQPGKNTMHTVWQWITTNLGNPLPRSYFRLARNLSTWVSHGDPLHQLYLPHQGDVHLAGEVRYTTCYFGILTQFAEATAAIGTSLWKVGGDFSNTFFSPIATPRAENVAEKYATLSWVVEVGELALRLV